jgi:hypothetical protein
MTDTPPNNMPPMPMLPIMQAACSLYQSTYPHHPHLKMEDMVHDLQATLHQEQAGDLDAVLVTQSRVLDSMFNHLTLTALARDDLKNRRMDEVLRLQKQCRQTIEALRRIEKEPGRKHRKYPWPMPFPDPMEIEADRNLEKMIAAAKVEIEGREAKDLEHFQK